MTIYDETTRAAIEAAARTYYGMQSVERPGTRDVEAVFTAAWDEGRVKPEVMDECRRKVTPIVLAVLVAVDC